MAGAGGGRCLSDLPNDLLRRILFFAPAREGAATAVLSRRWRWLWRTSGAVNLDSRSFNRRRCSSEDFVRGAEKALAAAAAHGPIRRLTLFVTNDSGIDLMTYRADLLQWWSVVDDLVSNPAARRVEELQIEVGTRCALNFGSPPFEALRVLLLRSTSFSVSAAAPPGVSFRRLASLHLQGCSVSPVDLQATIDSAPQLSTLHLASTNLTTDEPGRCYRLLCPCVTTLVLADCRFEYDYRTKNRLKIDASRLEYFTYKGHVQLCNVITLKPTAASSNIVQVDLHLTDDYHAPAQGPPARELFWQFVLNFSTTKLMKLRLDFAMDELALEDTASWDELLGGFSFCLLEQLELEAKYMPAFETSMVMLADLLHCCPMLRDLRLKLSKQRGNQLIGYSRKYEAGVDFDKSVNGFRNRRSRSMVSLVGENHAKYEVSSIPPFSTSAVACRVILKE